MIENLKQRFWAWLRHRLLVVAFTRTPDFIVGDHSHPYLLRWWLIPRNRFLNIYLHEFRRSDDDRALHDHPWINCSVLIQGQYTEHTIDQGGIHRREVLKQGAARMRWTGKFAHRVEITHGRCWTLFITGPVYRNWGFHCPEQGWVPWERFTAPNDKGSIGSGCEG